MYEYFCPGSVYIVHQGDKVFQHLILSHTNNTKPDLSCIVVKMGVCVCVWHKVALIDNYKS